MAAVLNNMKGYKKVSLNDQKRVKIVDKYFRQNKLCNIKKIDKRMSIHTG